MYRQSTTWQVVIMEDKMDKEMKPEDVKRMLLRKVSSRPQNYTASQIQIPQSPMSKLQNSMEPSPS
jgi:hypothetical protein